MKKIDIHCHTSDRLINGTEDRGISPQRILKHMDEHDISITVLLASYFPHKGSGISNFRLLRWIEEIDPNRERFIMFASLDAANYMWMGQNEIEELARKKLIHGIKIYTCYQEIDISSEGFNKILLMAEKYELPVMFHTGYSYASRMKYGKDSIATMYSAIDLFKQVQNFAVDFIFSHMSKPFFHEIMHVCKVPRIYTDMSGIIDSVHNKDEIPLRIEEIKRFLEICGPDKLLFGTDYPVQTHEHSVKFIEQAMIGYSEEDKRKVYFDNACRILNRRKSTT